MRIAVYVPLLASAVLGPGAPWLARWLPPATATWLLTGAATLAALATSFTLGVLAFVLLGQAAPVAALGHWSARALAATSPVPRLVAVAAAAAVLVLAGTGVCAITARARAMLTARRLCRRLGGQSGQLVVIDELRAEAFALPGDHGRIVVSRGLLQALTPEERRAVLAHETAHLAHRDHLHRFAVDLAAAVNPLLRPLAGAVRYSTERWADEDAAAALADRALVARTLARAGLLPSTPQPAAGRSPSLLDTRGVRLVDRVRCMLAPAPRQRPALVLAVTVLISATLAATVDTQQDAERLFENAMRPAAAHTRPRAAAPTATSPAPLPQPD